MTTADGTLLATDTRRDADEYNPMARLSGHERHHLASHLAAGRQLQDFQPEKSKSQATSGELLFWLAGGSAAVPHPPAVAQSAGFLDQTDLSAADLTRQAMLSRELIYGASSVAEKHINYVRALTVNLLGHLTKRYCFLIRRTKAREAGCASVTRVRVAAVVVGSNGE
ncbi:hypothetical protein [Geodermatophilus poikilotrophus]|uniref:Uncharacterized protein n=1 Tax=Geodermatophilus poikilotrophus TaxID=1333667 RepID=A0A1I0E2U6_9ACTN|nr:hypothetical protein [Geodermatophilus poikilotrophus]SET39295.1 hypothetical protein SAMN04488546_2310 [Geodermatophilus poikilotrophus]